MGRPAWAVWCLRGTASREPDHAAAPELFAWALVGVGRLEEAASIYRGLMAETPSSPALALIAWQFGSVLLRLERPADALGVFDAGIDALPHSANLHFNRGYALRWLGRAAESADAYQRAIRHDPTLQEGYSALVDLFTDLAKWEELNEVAGQWHRIQPSARAAHAMGTSRMMLGRFEDAVTVLEEARRLDPASPDIVSDLAGALDESGQSSSAEQILRDAIRQQPAASVLQVGLAHVLGEAGRAAEAIEAAETAIRLDPERGDAHAVLGSVLLATDAERARQAFEEALRRAPGMLEWQANLGAALSLAGRHTEALKVFDDVTQADPRFFQTLRGEFWLTYLQDSRRLAGRST